jgi:type III pantothenate kinase
MKLLLDIGNSRLKWAWAEGLTLEHCESVGYRPSKLAYALSELRLDTAPEAIWVSNVAGAQAVEAISAWAAAQWGLKPAFVKSEARACGLINAYAAPARLGVDRWLAMIAALHHGSGAVCVVDAGTALTVDAVSADGRHLGGLIAPGIASMRLILHERTQLSLPQEGGALSLFAGDTDSAIASGTLHGALALVERVYAELASLYDNAPRAELTGGESPLLHPHLQEGWTLAPHLVLEGLARYAVSRSTYG